MARCLPPPPPHPFRRHTVSTDNGKADNAAAPGSRIRVRSKNDALVRAAMERPDWSQVGEDTKAALAALYAEASADPGGGFDREFRERIDAVIARDQRLRVLVADCEAGLHDGDRDVLPVGGRRPEPYIWRCPSSGCTAPAVPGDSARPIGTDTCAKHPSLTLVRDP